MARILMLWTHPRHLSDDDASAWILEQVRRVASSEAVVHAELTRLQDASDGHSRGADWMLELHLVADADARRYVEAAACREWLGDLGLLGMQPSVALARRGIVLDGARS